MHFYLDFMGVFFLFCADKPIAGEEFVTIKIDGRDRFYTSLSFNTISETGKHSGDIRPAEEQASLLVHATTDALRRNIRAGRIGVAVGRFEKAAARLSHEHDGALRHVFSATVSDALHCTPSDTAAYFAYGIFTRTGDPAMRRAFFDDALREAWSFVTHEGMTPALARLTHVLIWEARERDKTLHPTSKAGTTVHHVIKTLAAGKRYRQFIRLSAKPYTNGSMT